MDDFYRRQRLQREQERQHERAVKSSASKYRLSLRSLSVAPYLRRRDAERKRRAREYQARAQASKVDLNASFYNSTQLHASPRNKVFRTSLMQRVASFRQSKAKQPAQLDEASVPQSDVRRTGALKRYTLFRKSSRARVSSSNPMFERSESDRSTGDYVVPAPFVLPIAPKGHVRKVSAFKRGKYFAPSVRKIIDDALAEKRAAEQQQKDEGTEEAGDATEQAVDTQIPSESAANSEAAAVSETIEEDAEENKSPTLAASGRAPSFLRGFVSGARPTSVPSAPQLSWPTWVTKLFAVKNAGASESDHPEAPQSESEAPQSESEAPQSQAEVYTEAARPTSVPSARQLSWPTWVTKLFAVKKAETSESDHPEASESESEAPQSESEAPQSQAEVYAALGEMACVPDLRSQYITTSTIG
jgi:hypothetical protein